MSVADEHTEPLAALKVRISSGARTRASRLRRKKNRTPEEELELRQYDAKKTPGKGRPVSLLTDPRSETGAGAQTEERASAPAPKGFAPIRSRWDSDSDDEDDDAGDNIVGPASHSNECKIVDCPACKTMRTAQTCVTTGKKVWPPMSEAGCKGLASLILNIIGLAIKLFRKDKHFVKPTESEVAAFGEALRELALRRASWLGAVDDLIAAGWCIGKYFARAAGEKPPKKEGEE